MSGITSVVYFLLSLFFDLVILAIWLRISIRFLKISSLHPIAQLSYTLTNPVLRPLNALLGIKYQTGERIDWTALCFLVLVESLKIITFSLLTLHALIPFMWICLFVGADLIIQPCNLLFIAILIRVIMSYVNPAWQHPFAEYLKILTQPLILMGRKIVPDISGFDFSPFIIMIILKVITLFISASLPRVPWF